MTKFSIIFIFTGEDNSVLLIDDKLPSIEFDGINNIEFHLESLCKQCVNYSYKSLMKMLSGCISNNNEIEIIYKITCPYRHSVNKIGNLISLNTLSTIEKFWSKYGKSISGYESCFR